MGQMETYLCWLILCLFKEKMQFKTVLNVLRNTLHPVNTDRWMHRVSEFQGFLPSGVPKVQRKSCPQQPSAPPIVLMRPWLFLLWLTRDTRW